MSRDYAPVAWRCGQQAALALSVTCERVPGKAINNVKNNGANLLA